MILWLCGRSKKWVCNHCKLVPLFMEWLQCSFVGACTLCWERAYTNTTKWKSDHAPWSGTSKSEHQNCSGRYLTVVAFKDLSLRSEPRDSLTLVLLIRLYDLNKIILFLDINCVVWWHWLITREIVKVYKNLGSLIHWFSFQKICINRR